MNRRTIACQAGISYVEMLVVLTLAGIVLALGLPSYHQYASNQRALIAARTLTSDLSTAQQEAVTRRDDVTVAFSSTSGACGGRPAYEFASGAGTIKRSCLPPDVVWASLPPTLTWDPTGITPTGATLTVRSALTGRTYNVWVAAQTGAITDDTDPR